MFKFTNTPQLNQSGNDYGSDYNNYDEGWGQHIAIDYQQNGINFVNRMRNHSDDSSRNSVTSLKDYLDNLADDYIPDIEPAIINIEPRIHNPDQFEIIYYSKVPLIVKAALYLYNFACYFTGYD